MRRRNDGAAVAMTAMLVSGMLLLSACGSADAVKTDAIGATEEMAQTGQAAACVVKMCIRDSQGDEQYGEQWLRDSRV